MNDHLSTERLNDLLDGLLTPDEEARASAHLDACADCRREHESLSGLLADVRDLPGEARAPEGMWAGIEARIAGARASDRADRPGERFGGGEARVGAAAEVIPIEAARTARRRFALTLPQLAAAAVIVALMSAGGMWVALSRPAPAGQPAVATTAPPFGSAARMAASGDAAYDQALLQLQSLVDQGRDVLAPETVKTLDESLQTIDDAITRIRDALAKDPSSELLNRMLINQQRTKLRVLRQAAVAMQARS